MSLGADPEDPELRKCAWGGPERLGEVVSVWGDGGTSWAAQWSGVKVVSFCSSLGGGWVFVRVWFVDTLACKTHSLYIISCSEELVNQFRGHERFLYT